MHAEASRLASQASSLASPRLHYEAPCDLLPWADPYIASLFASIASADVADDDE
jgi:hypothetical protein